MATDVREVVQHQRLAGVRVLLVEDDPDTREVSPDCCTIEPAGIHPAGGAVMAGASEGRLIAPEQVPVEPLGPGGLGEGLGVEVHDGYHAHV